ncbi:hypothetical protein ACFX1Q_046153 [Malus domestica]
MFGDIGSGVEFFESSDQELVARVAEEHRWGMAVTVVVSKIITLFWKPMELAGFLLDFLLNFVFQNGYSFGLLYNLLQGKVMVPQRDTKTFIRIFGHLDGRVDLRKGEDLAKDIVASISEGTSVKLGNPTLMDLCIMASKLAYENDKVIRKVVVDNWKMHFVDFCSCWNDFRKQMSTNLFILCDKPKDANLILISFQGREPF